MNIQPWLANPEMAKRAGCSKPKTIQYELCPKVGWMEGKKWRKGKWMQRAKAKARKKIRNNKETDHINYPTSTFKKPYRYIYESETNIYVLLKGLWSRNHRICEASCGTFVSMDILIWFKILVHVPNSATSATTPTMYYYYSTTIVLLLCNYRICHYIWSYTIYNNNM